MYFLVDRDENVFKSDTTIFTTIGDLFIPLKEGDEGIWNNESYLSEERSPGPTSPSAQSGRSFQDISSHKSVGEASTLTSAGQSPSYCLPSTLSFSLISSHLHLLELRSEFSAKWQLYRAWLLSAPSREQNGEGGIPISESDPALRHHPEELYEKKEDNQKERTRLAKKLLSAPTCKPSLQRMALQEQLSEGWQMEGTT